MTQLQANGTAALSAPILSDRENERAVDLIEGAEARASSCPCGSHMVAVAHDGAVWLECAERTHARQGLSGTVARLTAWTHSRHLIMELPSE